MRRYRLDELMHIERDDSEWYRAADVEALEADNRRLRATLTALATWLREAEALFRMSPNCAREILAKADAIDKAALREEELK